MDLVEEFARLGKALKWKIYYFIGFSAQASMLGVFFKQIRFRPGIHQPLRGILRFNFSYETDFWVNNFFAQKSSEMSTLSGSSPVFVSQLLTLCVQNKCGTHRMTIARLRRKKLKILFQYSKRYFHMLISLLKKSWWRSLGIITVLVFQKDKVRGPDLTYYPIA